MSCRVKCFAGTTEELKLLKLNVSRRVEDGKSVAGICYIDEELSITGYVSLATVNSNSQFRVGMPVLPGFLIGISYLEA
tara:strand:+ start:273 stop:509 length:237 start_codon:yes stop_codon:yes gene_type:complete